jgi:hypothetical protein
LRAGTATAVLVTIGKARRRDNKWHLPRIDDNLTGRLLAAPRFVPAAKDATPVRPIPKL